MGCFWIDCGREGIGNESSQAIKSIYGVIAVDGNTDSCWASRIASSEKGQAEISDWCPSLWLPNNSSQGLLHSKGQTDYNHKSCNLVVSTQGSVYNSTGVLGYSKSCARRVTRSVTGYHKTVREEACSDLPSGYEAHGESFLSWIVTGDKTWIHHFEPQTKGQSVEWHHPASWKKKFMATPSAGKVMESWSLFSGCRMGDFGRHCASWSNH